MTTKRKSNKLLIFSLALSVLCFIILNGPLAGEASAASNLFSECQYNKDAIFPEVQMIKVVIEKLIDVITIA